MDADLKRIVRDNVLALIQERTGELKPGETGITRLKRLGVSQGTAQRVVDGTTSIGLDMLRDVAAALKVEPWQMLVEDLDPKSLPGLTADSTAWPFVMVDRRAYWDLPEPDRIFVQGSLNNAIAERANRVTRTLSPEAPKPAAPQEAPSHVTSAPEKARSSFRAMVVAKSTAKRDEARVKASSTKPTDSAPALAGSEPTPSTQQRPPGKRK